MKAFCFYPPHLQYPCTSCTMIGAAWGGPFVFAALVPCLSCPACGPSSHMEPGVKRSNGTDRCHGTRLPMGEDSSLPIFCSSSLAREAPLGFVLALRAGGREESWGGQQGNAKKCFFFFVFTCFCPPDRAYIKRMTVWDDLEAGPCSCTEY